MLTADVVNSPDMVGEALFFDAIGCWYGRHVPRTSCMVAKRKVIGFAKDVIYILIKRIDVKSRIEPTTFSYSSIGIRNLYQFTLSLLPLRSLVVTVRLSVI